MKRKVRIVLGPNPGPGPVAVPDLDLVRDHEAPAQVVVVILKVNLGPNLARDHALVADHPFVGPPIAADARVVAAAPPVLGALIASGGHLTKVRAEVVVAVGAKADHRCLWSLVI